MLAAPAAAPRRSLLVIVGLAALGVAIRLNNVFRYPSDWGFDASFNWRYIYRMSRDWAIPHPAAGWSTGDPPLYFTVSALIFRGLEALGLRDLVIIAIPLLSTLLGLALVWLAVVLVRRVDPENPRRAWLAGGLLLFLPAHIQMSVMVNEQMLAALLTSLAVFALAVRSTPGGPAQAERAELQRAAATGSAAGLALLTKLSGAVAVASVGLSYAIEGLRAAWRPAATRAAVALLAAALVGGWYFARNQLLYGYVQPFGLPAHEMMFTMPPGERTLADYLRIPLATWSDPQLLNPDLLRSVWGSTYASVWFDTHRAFLPRESDAVRRLGTATLLLALLPTAAFLAGALRGLRRAARRSAAPDLPLCILLIVTLAGYALYTWRNPWFVVLKGTSLLALCLPFAFYASETLDAWLRRRGAWAWAVGSALAA
ncbi:MAG: phospholipid carrier-dependent glycosyltransferase, partial [Deltaproteobacteria bacterium]|nr:phospholipid carrier-dependent glycosyltransferase [Deltaproteobacteria bacterium]